MPFSQPHIDQTVAKMVGLGLPRAKATVVADVANHAIDEALHTVLRVCSTLPSSSENVLAIGLALRWLREASEETLDALIEAERQSRE